MDNHNDLVKRVRYQKSPLIEVIFQLQFPTILSIGSTLPVVFQERIRDRYPFFQEQTEEHSDVLLNPQAKAVQIRKLSENKNFSFVSSDNKYKVNLTPSFIAISTLAYSQWEEFSTHINFVIPIFEELYKPAFYTRIGLRYIDAITRSNLGLHEKPWTELIQPHILGMITPEHEAGVTSYLSETEYKTHIGNVMSKSHFEFVHVNNKTELSLLIDCDYFIMGITKIEEMKSVSNDLHNASSHFIQTAITSELHEAMQPVEIES